MQSDTSKNVLDKIKVKQWKQEVFPGLSNKAPTSILLKCNGDFVFFGYDAEETYYRMSQEETQDYRLFRRIKLAFTEYKVYFQGVNAN